MFIRSNFIDRTYQHALIATEPPRLCGVRIPGEDPLRSRIVERVCALLVGSILCFSVTAQSVPDVPKSFRKLEADTEAGMNYKEYARGMAEVNAQLKNFADSNGSKATPPAIKALQDAWEEFKAARERWDEQAIDDARYDNGQMSIQGYFDRKKAGIAEISDHWKVAGQHIARAATLAQRRGK